MFISSYGETDEREITFAHFSEDSTMGDLPTLKVLGWSAGNTVLRLEDTHTTLKDKLLWPENEDDTEAWRERWSSAFKLKYRETVRTSRELAVSLAELAGDIRARVNSVIEIESEHGELRKLYKAFQEALIHDLTLDDFADMYAQTIAYGLLTASISRQSGGLVADNLKDMVPNTNPFLKELMQTFLTVGGRQNKIDFDELGINEVVELLRHTQMTEVLKDFGAKNPQEDPVIHFYELFLKEYDPEKRMKRGVFYTPRPVVSFIVRSVDEILRTEFGLEDGLADTTTWSEMAKRSVPPAVAGGSEATSFAIPEGVDPHSPFVQILDPATGTGTFLVEVVDVIFQTLRAKWTSEKKTAPEMDELWNDYVPRHLLPRLHGFELMMAPYAIAHMKIGLKLGETHYSFLSSERARIYLTNTLEEPKEFSSYFEEMAPALAHEAHQANRVKQSTSVTIIIGNPPYSNMSANLGETARALIEKYKFIGTDRVVERNALQLERNLNDDYVKLIAWSEGKLKRTAVGVLSMISNNVYTWSPSLRGMRAHLMDSFSGLEMVNLHGASQRGPADPRFVNDENVFDIEQPVAIGTFFNVGKLRSVSYGDFVGPRESKYRLLLRETSHGVAIQHLVPRQPARRFIPGDSSRVEEYESYESLSSICPLFAEGIKTGHDWLVVDFDSTLVLERMREIQKSKEKDDALCERIGLSRKKSWNFARARSALRSINISDHITRLAYRPFDSRFAFYHPDWISSPSAPVMRNLMRRSHNNSETENLALLAGRISRDHKSRLYWCTTTLTDKCILSSLDNVSVFPGLVFPSSGKGELDFGNMPEPNLSREFLSTLEKKLNLGLTAHDPDGLRRATLGVFHYFYAILSSPSFRYRYAADLNQDFPRIPITSDLELFTKLGALGGDLVALHLLDDDSESASWNTSKTKYKNPLKTLITQFARKGDAEVTKGYPKYKDGNVCINPSDCFEGVPEEVWNFHIGGYQVCEKWLKDRRGRTLSDQDVNHYQRVIVALKETIRLMAEIDRVIEEHGGWPLFGSQDKPNRR
ncbi:MAG TPA: type ISP restriction/modification enzyme [Pyrinomonadaceae bacterium]|nr:type ISP restriction/modification enzyme [Pyrinomonadaceae bacterium]